MSTCICRIISGSVQSRRRPLDQGRSQKWSRQRSEIASRCVEDLISTRNEDNLLYISECKSHPHKSVLWG